jgi:hypothetical protein
MVAFDEATFSGGTVTFDGATFSGGEVRFSQATFSGGIVDFRRVLDFRFRRLDFLPTAPP